MDEVAVRQAEKPRPERHTVCLVSRCAWTFYNFRLNLATQIASGTGARVIGAGIDVDPYAEKITSRGIDFVKLRGQMHGQNPVHLFFFALDLYRMYRRLRPHVVHHFTIKPVLFGTFAARLAGVPKIVNTVAGLGRAFDQENRLTGLYVKGLYRLALRLCHHVFFQNEEDRSLFIRTGLVAESKTSVVPGSGVDLRRFSPVQSAGTQNLGGQPVVLMVARLLKTKGVREFAEAARIVRRDQSNVTFLLLGGLDFDNPAAIRKSDLDEWVGSGLIEWVGHHDDIRPFLRRADVVVLPSYYREGIPRSLLEAAATGKPIVTTDNTGCREVVEPGVNGLMVPPRDARALGDALIHLLGDEKLRQSMGEAGRKRMVERFDERFVVDRTIEIYGLCKT